MDKNKFIYKIGIYLAKYRLRSARGNAWTSELKGIFLMFSSGGVVLLLIDRYFHILLPIWWLPVLWFIQKVVEYFLGRLDEKHFKFWQTEIEYSYKEINPFNQDLMNKIDEIRENTKK